MKKKQKKYTTFENVVIFPGTVEKLISDAHKYVENYQYDSANKLFEEALKYTEGDEAVLSVYAYSLYEAKSFEKAKEVCEQLLSIGPVLYLEVMELYLTILMQLKQNKQVEQIISSLLEEGAIPPEQVDKFERLKELNANIAHHAIRQEDFVSGASEIDQEIFQLEKFLSFPTSKQLNLIHGLTTRNIRSIVNHLKAIIETEDTHPFIKSIVLVLLVEQQVNISIKISKFNLEKEVNPATLELPTKLPQFLALSKMMMEKLEKEPSTLEMVEYLLSKHAIVTYPLEWLDYDTDDVAQGYIDLVRTMFGGVQEMDVELVEFLQKLEKLAELQ
ncbi:tetratricopeptide repeat protein [Lysinibacillus yapensis]|uniref:Tetratricopeptide repeat protein n=1 Tax=Ureibacillus yapensis TaxID=2304605 RepID=A0A396S4D7_9BACL|nr:tetratricopeptide repeat protein [Lysinibacillus yapensis]RHW33383.1 tetratricopeptide repeat protein [Lysinibacillus yapensis]